MPKVTDAYREARRDEIAQAAVRCLVRKGVRDTSIADIVTESGLSTGAIYSHFTNKAELARYIVGRFLIVRIDALESAGLQGVLTSPRDVLTELLRTFTDDGLPASLVIQFWGEAMVEGALHDEMMRTAGRLGRSLTAALTPWARESAGSPSSDAAVADLAAGTARTIATLVQGYVANTAVFGPRDVQEYVASVVIALGE
jgi:AcrR family transcriptional regulator